MKRTIILTMALLALLPFVAMNALAADDVPRRGCRAGTPSEYLGTICHEYSHSFVFPANNSSWTYAQKNWAYPYVTTDTQGQAATVNDELTNMSAPAATLINANADGLASFVFMDGEATSVSGMPAKQSRPDRWYTLDGRRPGKKATGKGIYIHQGRKVVTERTE